MGTVPRVDEPTSAPADEVTLHVIALRVDEIANTVGYLARRYAPVLNVDELMRLADAEAGFRKVAKSLTAKAEAAGR